MGKIQVIPYRVISMRVLMLSSQTFLHKNFYYQSLQTSKSDAKLLILTCLVRLSECLQPSSCNLLRYVAQRFIFCNCRVA